MKVYLAARYDQRVELIRVASMLTAVGIGVTSRWLEGTHEIPGYPKAMDRFAEFLAGYFAAVDLVDIDRADAVILFTQGDLGVHVSGGKHVETGYALAKGKRVIVVGPRENVFHYLPHIEHYPTAEEFWGSVVDGAITGRDLDLQQRRWKEVEEAATAQLALPV